MALDIKVREDVLLDLHECTIDGTVVGCRLEVNRGFIRKLYDLNSEIVEPAKKMLGITEITSTIPLVKRKDSYYSQEELNNRQLIVNEITVLGELIMSMHKNDFLIINA